VIVADLPEGFLLSKMEIVKFIQDFGLMAYNRFQMVSNRNYIILSRFNSSEWLAWLI